ncbi:uncharacterized protein LOC110234935 [Exaiptasia diaphana]|uniref:ISXO2-like transposase domain-containing protein n=1 Tax=Exaiptasia diaphana TaxID=2652724 RepID=A0A913WYE0_EXADI|nr:uncharacterized protein LOC110234935 [Exaiptasia diaphana]KXJ16816.1 hypothetical protein AC249_AIPGENE22789 [Exaiptasia diaphana]
MVLTPRRGTHIDGWLWQCDRCRKKRSLRTNSFFSQFQKTKLEILVEVLYFWSAEDGVVKTARHLGISKHLVSRVFKALRRICSLDIIRRPFYPFGGPHDICKCDESMFTYKSKYNRGRRAKKQTWVFGISSTEFQPARGYFQVVEKRDRATLIPLIQMLLKPGSELHTDDWGAYENLTRHSPNVSIHRVVVHNRHFLNPVTRAHTQESESGWATMKLKIATKKGIRPQNLQMFLDEQMWRDHKTSKGEEFEDILAILPLYFPNPPQ